MSLVLETRNFDRIQYSDFHQSTIANFEEISKPDLEKFFNRKFLKKSADFISKYKGKYDTYYRNGSCYWYVKKGNARYLVRLSDHWGDVASCTWNINKENWLRITNFDCRIYSHAFFGIIKLSDMKRKKDFYLEV